MGVSVSGKYLENTIINSKQCHIKRSTPQVKHKHIRFPSFFIHSIGNSGRCGLVNNTLHLHSRNGARIFGSLTLSIVEISRNSDDCIVNILSEEYFCSKLHLLQNHS
mmetsp:Transcript_42257/g.99158  ORF Transcript_42257/g.99158 Transcript_42257/m.99158 type:complete len:107 (-) Transcript_42257:549-869(-)